MTPERIAEAKAAANRLKDYDLANFQGPQIADGDMRAAIVVARAFLALAAYPRWSAEVPIFDGPAWWRQCEGAIPVMVEIWTASDGRRQRGMFEAVARLLSSCGGEWSPCRPPTSQSGPCNPPGPPSPTSELVAGLRAKAARRFAAGQWTTLNAWPHDNESDAAEDADLDTKAADALERYDRDRSGNPAP